MEIRRRIILGQKKEKIAYEAWNLSFTASEKRYIDTGVYLFTEENINKDFEVIIEGLCGTYVKSQTNTIICAKHNGLAYGFFIRCSSDTARTYKGTIMVAKSPYVNNIVVKRINGVLSVEGDKITNQTATALVPFTNMVHTHPLVLGCALEDDGTPYRYATGTIDHIVVKWL